MSDFCKNVDIISNLVYDDEKNALDGGSTMKAKELIGVALKSLHKTQAEAAAAIGWSPQQLSSRLVRNSLRADEFITLLDSIGVDITLTVRESGKVIKEHITGYGRRVRLMVDKVVYDTDSSNAIANNFFADGINEYTDGKALELYIDEQGRYFFAEYSSWEGAKDRITPVTAKDAVAFIEKYGTEIHKKPKTE